MQPPQPGSQQAYTMYGAFQYLCNMECKFLLPSMIHSRNTHELSTHSGSQCHKTKYSGFMLNQYWCRPGLRQQILLLPNQVLTSVEFEPKKVTATCEVDQMKGILLLVIPTGLLRVKTWFQIGEMSLFG